MAHFVKMSDGKYFFAPSMRYLKGLAQAQHSSMTRYWAVWGAILAFLLVGLLVAEALDVPLLADPIPWLTRGGLLGAILAVALLTVDAVLPVPASLVVVTAGALYGTVTGAFLALLGRVLMALAGYAIGQRGGPLVAQLVPRNGRDRADGLLRRWGVMAMVLTRPMPLLAETVTILAGVSSIGWYRWRGHRPAAECGRRRLRKHWFLASFALHRWLDRPPHSQDRRLQAEVARPSALLGSGSPDQGAFAADR